MRKILVTCLLFVASVAAYCQPWFYSFIAHGRDISASAVLSPDALLLGGGFEVAEHFEGFYTSFDYGIMYNQTSTDSPTSQVMSMAFKDELNGFGVCKKGKIVKTVDGANVWTTVIRFPNRHFFKIIYATPQVLFVAGGSEANDTSSIYRSSDSGATWSAVYNAPGQKLYAIRFIDALTGFAVGGNSQILKTVNGGTTWTPISSPIAGRTLNGIAFTDPSTGYCIGGIRDSIRTILKTTDGGDNWSIEKDEAGGGLNDITFINATEGYIVGDSATILKTTNGGVNWVPQTIPNTDAAQRLLSVSFYNSTLGVVTGMGGYVRVYAAIPPPQAITQGHLPLDTNNAILTGKLNTYGIPAQCFYYVSTDSNLTFANSLQWGGVLGSNTLVDFTAGAGLMHPGTTYYYSLRVTGITGTSYGDTLSLQTGYPSFTFSSNNPQSVTDTTAVFWGLVDNFPAPVTLSFDYGTSLAMLQNVAATPAVVNNAQQHNITAAVTNLIPHRIYYGRMRGVTANGTYFSPNFMFYTGKPFETLFTLSPLNVTDSTAVLRGEIKGATVPLTLSFEFDTLPQSGNTIPAAPNYITDTLLHSFSATATQLRAYTTYYYRARAQAPTGTFTGITHNFFTGNLNYVFNTLPATNVTGFSAQLNGEVDKIGLPVSLRFEYGTSASLGTTVSAVPSSINDTLQHFVSLNLNQLTPFTTYYYRLTAQYANGLMTGSIHTFTTSMPATDFQTLAAGSVTSNSAVLNGMVNHLGTSTNLSFEYGTTPAFGNTVAATPSVVADTLLHNVWATVTGLQNNSIYFYRLRGTGTGGINLAGNTMQLFTGSSSIPNWDFQLWDTSLVPLPANWNIINGRFTKVAGHTGSALKIFSANAAVLGNLIEVTVPGQAFAVRPDSVIFYADYQAEPGDTMGFIVIMLQNGSPIHQTICHITGNSGGGYKRLAYPLNYSSLQVPDSVIMGFATFNAFEGQFSFHPTNYLTVDDISFFPSSPPVVNGNFETWYDYKRNKALGWYFMEYVGLDSTQIENRYVRKSLFQAPADYALELENIYRMGILSKAGVATNDKMLGSESEGCEVSARHQTINGYYKFFPVNGDTLRISGSFHYQGQGIGYFDWIATDSATSFTPFQASVTYSHPTQIPDTMRMSIDLTGRGTSRALVDKLSFDGFSVAIYEPAEPVFDAEGWKVYPNPTNSLLAIEISKARVEGTEVVLWNLNGQPMLQTQLPAGETKITLSTAGLNAGIYTLRSVCGSSVLTKRVAVIE